MNIPGDIAKQVVDSLRGTPFVMAILLVNVIMLAGFTYTLYSVAGAQERRDAMIKSCIDRR